MKLARSLDEFVYITEQLTAAARRLLLLLLLAARGGGEAQILFIYLFTAVKEAVHGQTNLKP